MEAIKGIWDSLGTFGQIAVYNVLGSIVGILVLKIPGIGPWLKTNVVDALLANLVHKSDPPK